MRIDERLGEETLWYLRARLFFYQLFQKYLGNEPVFELFEAGFAQECTSVLGDLAAFSPQFEKAQIAYGRLVDMWRDDPGGFLENAKREYMVMFIGPASLKAPPWESVYRSAEPLLFQKSTLEVRRAYQQEDYIPDGYPHVADDHIAYELDFMAKLAERIAVVIKVDPDFQPADHTLDENTNENEYDVLDAFISFKLRPVFNDALLASSSFLEEHLLKWVPDYIKAAQYYEQFRIYPTLLEIMMSFLQIDKSVLVFILDDILDDDIKE